MALAVKVAGVSGLPVDDNELHLSAFLQSRDARHLSAARTGAATRQGDAAVWNEELLLQMSTEATSTVNSVLLELRSGSSDPTKESTSSAGILGFATIEWSDISAHATGHGWAVEPELLSGTGAPLGAKLFVRLLFTDTSSAAAELRDLKSALSDAMSTQTKERSALQATAEGHERQLAQARAELGLKLRVVQQRATDSEVSHFRTALDKRLLAARTGRDDALRNFHRMHQQALSDALPTVAERLARSAQQQAESIGRVASKARSAEAAAAEAMSTQWSVALPAERDRTISKLEGKTTRAMGRVHAAFRRATDHEGATLSRRLRKIAAEAEEKASRDCISLHKQVGASPASPCTSLHLAASRCFSLYLASSCTCHVASDTLACRTRRRMRRMLRSSRDARRWTRRRARQSALYASSSPASHQVRHLPNLAASHHLSPFFSHLLTRAPRAPPPIPFTFTDWQTTLQSHFITSREQLGRTLLEQQAAHREQRAQRRVVDASADQTRRAAYARRESLLGERQSAVQKEVCCAPYPTGCYRILLTT